jgi:cyclophilin family peptidyl-prolyl cis-trans isomerase
MRAILIVLGIAIFGIVLSTLFSRPKDLTPFPQEREDQRKNAYNDASNKALATNKAAEPAFNPPREGAIQAVLTVEGRGDVVIEMYPKAAPKTVAHLKELIAKGFYNGIRVHRVEPGFVVQLGDPQTKSMAIDARAIGSGGSGQNIPFEQSNLLNLTGTVAMALSGPRSDTGDSQFFINLKHNDFLDGDYCVFGKVVQGMDVVGTIQKKDKVTSFKLK